MAGSSLPPAEYVARIIAAAAEFRIADYDRLTAEAREQLPPVVLIRDVFAPVLREAGDRWRDGRFTVVQEHMLTSAVKRQLTYALDAYNRLATGTALAFTTLEGERHELGILMLAVMAASRGFRALYLGPDLPVAEVGHFCRRVPVGAVAISIVTGPEVIDAALQLRELRAVLSASTEIWLGGRATGQIHPEHLPANSILVRNLDEFERRLANLPTRSDIP